jgi:DNA-binding HxlR family transcriptional regulator
MPTLATRIRHSSVSRALEVFGDRWSLLILRDAFLGVSRFEELRRSTGAARGTLAARLTALVEAGILARDAAPRAHGRLEYHLTERGRDLYPVTLMIWRWEQRWGGDGRLPPALHHAGCGRSFMPLMCCAHCRSEVALRDTGWQDGRAVRRAPPPGAARRFSPGARAGGGEDLLAGSIGLLGDRWSALLVCAQFFGVHRFDALQQELAIATNVLSDRLARLVRHGILRRVRYEARPPRFEYHLTRKGEALFPFTVALLQWGDRWLAPPGREPLLLFHRPCGARLVPLVTCSRCAAPVQQHDVSFTVATAPRGRSVKRPARALST